MGALKLAENPVFHQRSKHVDIKYHYIRDTLRDGTVKIEHVPTTEVVADFLTKGLQRKKHMDCLMRAGMCGKKHSVSSERDSRGSVGTSVQIVNVSASCSEAKLSVCVRRPARVQRRA